MFQIKRRLRQVAIELSLYPMLVFKNIGPRLAVLPSHSPSGASLLRGYNIASELRRKGWQTIVLPSVLSFKQRQRVLRLFRPDLVFAQSFKHPFNRADHLAEWPFVYDIDDAHFLLPGLEAEVASLASSARGVICGSRFIRDWARLYNPRSKVVWTGTPINTGARIDHADRRPLVTWAQLGPDNPRYRAELDFIAEVMVSVAHRRGGVALRLYSLSDENDLPALVRMREAGVQIEFTPKLDYDAFLMSLQDATVGLSAIVDQTGFVQGKSFGKILGYLDAKVPVICSDAADHGLFFRPDTGVVSNNPDVWVDAIDSLLDDPERRAEMSEAAYADFVQHLSLQSAARQVDAFLKSLLHESNSRD